VLLSILLCIGGRSTAASERFIEEVSSKLLCTTKPLALGSLQGWHGFVLCSHALPVDLEELFRTYNSPDNSQYNRFNAVTSIDRPISVADGIGTLTDESIGEIWGRLLDHSEATLSTESEPSYFHRNTFSRAA
jgi:hypothetical protein